MEKVSLENLFDITFLSDVKFSPDGKHAAFVAAQGSLSANKYNTYIWLYSMDSEKLTKLTTAGEERNFEWLNNDEIIFACARNEKDKAAIKKGAPMSVFYKVNIHGGEGDKFLTFPIKASKIRLLDSGKYLISSVFDNYGMDYSVMNEDEKEKALKETSENNNAYKIFDEIPFWQNGIGVTNKKRNRLYIYDEKTSELTPISPALLNIINYSLDGNRLVYTGAEFENMMTHKSSVYTYDLSTGENKPLCLGVDYSVGMVQIIGENIVFTGRKVENINSYENSAIYIIPYVGGEVKPLYDGDFSMGSSVGSDCKYGAGTAVKEYNGDLYYLSTRRYSSYLFKLNVASPQETKISPDVTGAVDCFDIKGNYCIYVAFRNKGLGEIYILNLETGEEKSITEFNKKYLEEHSISYPEYFTFNNRDGVDLDGFVIKPVGYEAGKKYPAILDMHGGPKATYGDIFFHEMQLWANEGYFVFFTNPRGSEGRGSEFANIVGERYLNWDYNDFMDFTDKVLELYPDIDTENVGCTGGSYGGLMTNWIIGHTNRFKAAASQRSIANFISKCLTTDIGYYHNLNQMGTDPWTNESVFWDHSPLKYADKCVTPTLFIHSDQDYRCYMGDALQMFTALKMHGCDSRMCLFHGENHELSRSGKPKNRLKRLDEITSWFNNYMK